MATKGCTIGGVIVAQKRALISGWQCQIVRTTAFAVSFLTVWLAAGGPAHVAAAGLPKLFKSDPNKATSSREARREAIQAIPWDKLDPQSQAQVSSVVSRTTIFRRMPTRAIQCDPELYLFLVRHPDVVVNIWEVLGISQLKLRQTGNDTFQVADGVGTLSTMKFLYHSHDTHLIYADGRYDGPLFTKPVRGRGVLLLRTAYVREPDGRYRITSRLDSFLQLDPGGAELLTKTFQPLVGRVADNNFVQTTAFLGSLSRTAEVNTQGVARLAGRLGNVEPAVRNEFAAIAARVAVRAKEERPQARASRPPRIAARPKSGSQR